VARCRGRGVQRRCGASVWAARQGRRGIGAARGFHGRSSVVVASWAVRAWRVRRSVEQMRGGGGGVARCTRCAGGEWHRLHGVRRGVAWRAAQHRCGRRCGFLLFCCLTWGGVVWVAPGRVVVRRAAVGCMLPRRRSMACCGGCNVPTFTVVLCSTVGRCSRLNVARLLHRPGVRSQSRCA